MQSPGRELSRTSSMVHQCLAKRAAEWNALPTSPAAWTAWHRIDLAQDEFPSENHGKICSMIDPLGISFGKIPVHGFHQVEYQVLAYIF